MKNLEEKLQSLLQAWQPEQLKNVSSIKGLGKRASAMLIIFTQGFKNTRNHRQLISMLVYHPRNTAVERAFRANLKSASEVVNNYVMFYTCVP